MQQKIRKLVANLIADLDVTPCMDTKHLRQKYEKIGARVKIQPLENDRWRSSGVPLRIDIGRDKRGEFFDIRAIDFEDVEVLDIQPKDRHLLLMVRQSSERPGMPDTKDKFLCGHDERHWFVAGVPEKASVSTVITAKESLKPDVVRTMENGKKGKRAKFHLRKTEVFVRQGEWFFMPSPDIHPKSSLVIHDEPLRRGRGKPHTCEFLYRTGGTTVYVCPQYPNGLTDAERKRLFDTRPQSKNFSWRAMQRDPLVYVRGRVSHADHATITLHAWHRVAVNTESLSRAKTFVAFLD